MASFTEDFNSYELGELAGQGGWVCNTGAINVVNVNGNNLAEGQTDDINYYRPIPNVFYFKYHGSISMYPAYEYSQLSVFGCPGSGGGSAGYGCQIYRGGNDGERYDIRSEDTNVTAIASPNYYGGDLCNVDFWLNVKDDANARYELFETNTPSCSKTNIMLNSGMRQSLEASGFNSIQIIQDNHCCTGKAAIDNITLERYGQKKYNKFPKWKQTLLGMRPSY